MSEANTMADITGQDETVEQEIQRKGLTAPRVTPADIEANIASVEFLRPSLWDSTLTICVITLQNGTDVVGVSACASPENFNVELGQRISRQKAVEQIWPLMGYALKQQLHERAQPDPDAR